MSYDLFIKSDSSSYSWLHANASEGNKSATNAIEKWVSCFSSMPWLATPYSPHLPALLITSLSSEIKVRYHGTAASGRECLLRVDKGDDQTPIQKRVEDCRLTVIRVNTIRNASAPNSGSSPGNHQ